MPGRAVVPAALVREVERSYRAAFSDVAFSIAEAPARSSRTFRNTVSLAVPGADPGTAVARLVLAHELAHVLQLRAGATSLVHANVDALEREAALAAVSAVAGLPFRPRLAADPNVGLAWGRPGHYYTVYLVMLAAGVDSVTAQRMALYAQTPDLVSEIDAKACGIDLVRATPDLIRSQVPDMRSLPVPPAAPMPSDFEKDLWVQTGLHALTGGNSAAETRSRTANLEAAAFGSIDFGLALHAFGDSFAHRTLDDETVMYVKPLGHLVEWRPWRTPTCPDDVGRRPRLFSQYGLAMYDIVCSATPARGDRIGPARLGAALDAMSSVAGETAQIAMARALALRATKQAMDFYDPPDESVPWSAFSALHPEMPQDFLARALALARRWSP